MLNNLLAKRGIVACVIGVAAVAIALFGFVGRKVTKARADNVVLREPNILAEPEPTPSIVVRPSPLASIPWKRDCDTFDSITISPAQLPWRRSTDQPTAVACPLADLPWTRNVSVRPSAEQSSIAEARIDAAALPWDEHRMNAYAPVDLPTIALPWRY